MRALLRNGKLPRPRLDVEESTYVHARTVTLNGRGTDYAFPAFCFRFARESIRAARSKRDRRPRGGVGGGSR